MERAFTPETIQAIVRNVPGGAFSAYQERTPLHVNFSAGKTFVGAAPLLDVETKNQDLFNAIGSAVRHAEEESHLPVIDVDGGATAQHFKHGSKVVLGASHEGRYEPSSLLRDVLGDYHIQLEVFQHPTFRYSTFAAGKLYDGERVGAIVLRSTKQLLFEAVNSTTPDHAHVYIQREFNPTDHRTLIQELGKVGVISPAWQQLAEETGMGIVRTPWTQKQVDHTPS